MSSSTKQRLGLVLIVLVIASLKSGLPYGEKIMYPFALLATWFHEIGHAIASIVMGHSFSKIYILSDASGQTQITNSLPPLHLALISLSGLLAPSFLGSLLVITARKFSRVSLFVLAIVLFLSLLFWVKNNTAWIVLFAIAVGLILLALLTSSVIQCLTMQFLGLLIAIDPLTTRLYYFFISRPNAKEFTTDIDYVAKGLPIGTHAAGLSFWANVSIFTCVLFVAAALFYGLRTKRALT